MGLSVVCQQPQAEGVEHPSERGACKALAGALCEEALSRTVPVGGPAAGPGGLGSLAGPQA